MTPPLHVLRAGVDTLHLSTAGALEDGALLYVADVKREAAATDDPMVVTLGSGTFALRVRPQGWRRYPIWASSPELELFLGAPIGFPPAFAQCHAVYLHGAGTGAVRATVTDWHTPQLFAHIPPVLAVSRIGVYADGEGWVPTHHDLQRFTCRATARRAFVTTDPASVHPKGVPSSGFTFGKGAITAKVYDKSAECRLRGATGPATEWTARTGDGPVWRVEFAFRPAARPELGIQTPQAAVARRQAAQAMDALLRPGRLLPPLPPPAAVRGEARPSVGVAATLAATAGSVFKKPVLPVGIEPATHGLGIGAESIGMG